MTNILRRVAQESLGGKSRPKSAFLWAFENYENSFTHLWKQYTQNMQKRSKHKLQKYKIRRAAQERARGGKPDLRVLSLEPPPRSCKRCRSSSAPWSSSLSGSASISWSQFCPHKPFKRLLLRCDDNVRSRPERFLHLYTSSVDFTFKYLHLYTKYLHLYTSSV